MSKNTWAPIAALSAVVLLAFASPSYATGILSEVMEARSLALSLMSGGGLVVAAAFTLTKLGNKKTKAQIQAYEDELEKFRRSIR